MSEVGILVQQQDHASGHKHGCNECSFSTSHLPALRTHMAVQHKEKDKLKPLACKFCGYRTSYRGNLKKHVRIHTGEKPFSCQYCGKNFASKSNHKTHETTHTRHKFSKCPVPQCFFMCSRPELEKHIAQAHSGGLDLSMPSPNATKLKELRDSSFESKPDIKQAIINKQEDLKAKYAASVRKELAMAARAAGMPTMVPQMPNLTLFEREAMSLPSNTLIWSMQQESVLKKEPVFPTYGQQPVFPGGIVFPGQIPPPESAELGSDAEKDATVSSESESCCESTDGKRPGVPMVLEEEAELMRQSYTASSPDRSEASDKDSFGVPADSTSGQHSVSDASTDTPSSKVYAPSAVVSPSVRSPTEKGSERCSSEEVLAGERSGSGITKALFERKMLDSKSGGWAHVANVVNSLVQSNADADAVVNTLVDQGHLFHCMHCNIFFPEYSTYVLHRSCHDHNEPFQCHFCQASFPEKFGFLTHFMQCAKK